MEALEWVDCNETLDDILKNPRVQLPQLIKLSSTINDISTNEGVHEGQILVIHSKETVETINGIDSADNTPIILPLKCPFKTRRKVAPGKGKVFESASDLANSDPLPKFVEVKEAQDVLNLTNGDRLKVVIVEKSGGNPSVIHLRSSSGKHIKISVTEKISFQSSVSDGSDHSIEKLSEKSREFPLTVEFQKIKGTPVSYTSLDIFTIRERSSVDVVIASTTVNSEEYGVIFPLDTEFKFQVSSKLKMAKDEGYRELCKTASAVDPLQILEFVNQKCPKDSQIRYVLKIKKLLKVINFDYSDESSKTKEQKPTKDKQKKDSSKIEKEKAKVKPSEELPTLERNDSAVDLNDKNDFEEPLPPNTLVADSEQQEILKRLMKEREKQIRHEKEQLKAEKKKDKKIRKEREKEEKKKKKLSTSSISSPTPSSPIEIETEDLYIVPQDSMITSEPESPQEADEEQSQFALYLMRKVKKVRDRTTSLGFKPKSKKRGKLRKEDIEFVSGEHTGPQEDLYSGLNNDEAFSECLYEALPGEMAYESLDLVAQAQRSLALPIPTENSGDSGFDEIDQARIKAWRDSMAPPPLPGNHPLQQQHAQVEEENLYETAIDCKSKLPGQNIAAWQNFYDSVHQSTNEIATWDMEDVAQCLTDLLLSNFIEVFSDSQVDGKLLLDLDESVLKDLGLSAFEARKLRKFVFGWRPDFIRPPTYPERSGFDSKEPAQWNEADVSKHLKIIDLNDFSTFCEANQVNGELLKDICVDDILMGTIITTKDKKLKTVKIKNYVIDKWRPKKKGEGNYMSSQSILPPEKRSMSTTNVNKIGCNSPKFSFSEKAISNSAVNINKLSNTSPKTSTLGSTSRKVTSSGGDAPLIARMKQQLEENKKSWEKKK